MLSTSGCMHYLTCTALHCQCPPQSGIFVITGDLHCLVFISQTPEFIPGITFGAMHSVGVYKYTMLYMRYFYAFLTFAQAKFFCRLKKFPSLSLENAYLRQPFPLSTFIEIQVAN